MQNALIKPPRPWTDDGRERRIGAEIEFSNLTCRDAAELVQKRFGGEVEEKGPYKVRVRQTVFGEFTIELDSQYAHGPEKPDAKPDASPPDRDGSKRDVLEQVEAQVHAAFGDITSLWLPIEIVTPPVPLSALPELDATVADLRDAGAAGTDEGLLYAFATQLNPEVPSRAHEDILRHLRGFLLMSDRLRKEIDLDIKRRLLPFADPFPTSYVRRVLDPDYRPSLAQMIDDYLDANPTRNRELDLLPLFAELDPGRVRRRIDDPRIKARPAFHYRLPDTRLSDPKWGLVVEWNRWVAVEQLAADEGRLRAASEAFLAKSDDWLPREWLNALERLLP